MLTTIVPLCVICVWEGVGKEYVCTVCQATAASIPSLRKHFEKKHVQDAEKWAMSPEGAALLDELQGGMEHAASARGSMEMAG